MLLQGGILFAAEGKMALCLLKIYAGHAMSELDLMRTSGTVNSGPGIYFLVVVISLEILFAAFHPLTVWCLL